MVPFALQYQPQRKSYDAFLATAHTVIETLTFQICDLGNVGQGHEVQQLQWSQLMKNIYLYEVTMQHLYNIHRSRDMTFEIS